jgi:hypothetical protein
VHKGVDLISSGGIGDINQRQSTLLEITQKNIKDLFDIVEKSLLVTNERPDSPYVNGK